MLRRIVIQGLVAVMLVGGGAAAYAALSGQAVIERGDD